MPSPSKSTSKKGTGIGSLIGDKVDEVSSRKPLWEGPYSEGRNGGVTYSLLSRFLVDRHRFWLRTIEGLKQDEGFDYKMEYGNAWHYCEEHFAKNTPWDKIKSGLYDFCKNLSKSYPMSSKDVLKIYECCVRQFPIYVDYWKKHPDVKNRKPLGQEETFKVKYTLPDGRIVVLRGKFDARDILNKSVYIQENKSRSDVDREKIARDVVFDLQSNMYIICSELHDGIKVGGVRYNVIRRPLSGFKYNIKQKVGLGKSKKGAETLEEFYNRLEGLIKENSHDFFARVRMDMLPGDVQKFQRMVFNPVLMQLCNWWESIQSDPFNPWMEGTGSFKDSNGNFVKCAPITNVHHFMFPYGVYNPALEGRSSSYDELVLTGNERGFERSETLFRELE